MKEFRQLADELVLTFGSWNKLAKNSEFQFSFLHVTLTPCPHLERTIQLGKTNPRAQQLRAPFCFRFIFPVAIIYHP